MVQEVRRNEPQYSCIVPIESLTGNQNEEIMTFGVSAAAATEEAERLLSSQYGCAAEQIAQLLDRATVEPLGHWCATDR
ncbi:hypothetical protein [Phormidium sp. CCY1219]|uniref:hypothetical protein n=1 Tax=Phormidium sp. CCY1219 TaxID=2886104 RepID=UPI002D1EEFAC|nr:hypothetical protein [Phormidium sp. CCY1219]MEB3829079.1 hypothetical protein [Phormidium sp. CCY1219]